MDSFTDGGGGGSGSGWDLLTQGDPAHVTGALDLTRYQTYTIELQFPVPLPDWGWLWTSIAHAVQSQLPNATVGVWVQGSSLFIGVTRA